MIMANNNGVMWARLFLTKHDGKQNPLHVSICKTNLDCNLQEVLQRPTVVAVVPLNNDQNNSALQHCLSISKLNANQQCIFAHCTLSDMPRQDDILNADQHVLPPPPEISQNNSHPLLDMFCTQVFLNNYQLYNGQLILIKCVRHVFPIDRVVLLAKTRKALEYAQSDAFQTGLLLSVCEKNVLIQQGNSFLPPSSNIFSSDDNFLDYLLHNLHVVSCEPVAQGMLTVKTEVVVLKGITQSDDENKQKVQKHSEPIMLSKFLANPHLSIRKKGRHTDGLCGKKEKHILNRGITVNLIAKPQCDILEDLNRGKVNPAEIDVVNSIFIRKEFAIQFGIFHGSFLKVRLLSPDHQEDKSKPTQNAQKTTGCISRVVRVVVLMMEGTCLEETQDSVVISMSLLFNLHKNDEVLPFSNFQQINLESFMLTPEVPSTCSAGLPLPFASEVYIACVNSAEYGSSVSFKKLLQDYFKTARLIQVGDVIYLNSEEDFSLWQELNDNKDIRNPTVFFKVVKILPKSHGHKGTYFADIHHSTLYQEGSVHSFIPSAASALCQLVQLGKRLQPFSDPTKHLCPPGLSAYLNNICNLIRPYLSISQRKEETWDLYPSILLAGTEGSGKTCLARSVACMLHLHFITINCHNLCGETGAVMEKKVKSLLDRAQTYGPCIVQLKAIETLCKDRDGTSDDPRVINAFQQQMKELSREMQDWPVVIIATTTALKKMNTSLRQCFLHQVEIESLTQEQRLDVLQKLTYNLCCAQDLDLPRIAQRTAGMALGDLCALLSHSQDVSLQKGRSLLKRSGHEGVEAEEDLCLAGLPLCQTDVEDALNIMQAAHSDAIGAPKIPNVSWADVGGLANVKQEILDTVQLPLQHPELLAAGLRRSGVLFYGPPGTGKTLLAKAVATECALNFLSVKGPELINMYVGQSEENVREVFKRARSASPCVIFFDELDSLAPNRGRSGDSGGVMDRVVSQLLAELDGLNKSADVFVIGATNRPDLLDPALLRPGRFDKLLYLGVSEDDASQLNILKALTRKFLLVEGCDLERVVKRCPNNMTGADFYALCSDAMLTAMKNKIERLDAGDDVDQTKVEVGEEDFLQALGDLVPSVSEQELLRYKVMQRTLAQQ